MSVHKELVLSYDLNDPAVVDRLEKIMLECGQLRRSPQVAEADLREFVTIVSRQFNWESCGDPALQKRYNELFFKKGLNKVFGSQDPEFFVCYVGQCLVFMTINKFNVPQPGDYSKQLACELESRIAHLMLSLVPSPLSLGLIPQLALVAIPAIDALLLVGRHEVVAVLGAANDRGSRLLGRRVPQQALARETLALARVRHNVAFVRSTAHVARKS